VRNRTEPRQEVSAPAKFEMHDEADKFSIAAYTLRHLSGPRRDRLYGALHKPVALCGEQLGNLSEVGAEVPASTLKGLERLPEQLLLELPELKSLVFARVGQQDRPSRPHSASGAFGGHSIAHLHSHAHAAIHLLSSRNFASVWPKRREDHFGAAALRPALSVTARTSSIRASRVGTESSW
jgi:hypothetical protein